MARRRRRWTAREIAARQRTVKASEAQLWFLVALALLTIGALLSFRDTCGRQVSSFFDMLAPVPARDAGTPHGGGRDASVARPTRRGQPRHGVSAE